MKIYTKKGDEGFTGLIGGTRISKADLRIEAYGTVDELNSYVGFLRDYALPSQMIDQLVEIQDRLFTLGSQLANDPEKSQMTLPPLYAEDLSNLEAWMDEMDKDLPPMKSFVLPGGHHAVSAAHICRTVCRRAERHLVRLNIEIPLNPLFMQYLNRLSDYFFVLSRKLSQDFKSIEQVWKPRV